MILYGMANQKAVDKYNGGLKNYRAEEGRLVHVPYKGPVETILQQITGGLRSACTYVGANSLKDLSKCTTFVRCNRTHNSFFENNQ
jgi:GMP reductase